MTPAEMDARVMEQLGLEAYPIVTQVYPRKQNVRVMHALAERGPLPPIIMVTGTGNERVAVQAMKLGACDYLVKDVDGGYLQLLPTVIEQVLEQRRLTEEKQRTEEALRGYAAELEARNEELDAFAHTVAHDLKNPLHQIEGYAYLLREDYAQDLDDIGQECVDSISQAVETATNIINALLLLASVRQEDVERESVPMGVVVSAALSRLQPVIEDADATVTVPESWPDALGYAPWVEEVWVNYITNAIKYGGRPDEGLPPQVSLGADDSGEQPRYWVRDNGRGLTAEEQSRLFQPFSRLGQVQVKGHGLGLSIVWRIIHKLNGEVAVESEVGEGSTFSFTLPRAPSL